jgi:hypothetical protein
MKASARSSKKDKASPAGWEGCQGRPQGIHLDP